MGKQTEYKPDLSTLRLSAGVHKNREDGVCLLEAVAWWAGEPHSNQPVCICPTLTPLCAELNDAMPDEERSMLIPLIPRLAGSRVEESIEWERAFYLADYALRETHALKLEYWGYDEQALEILMLSPITNHERAAQLANLLASQTQCYPPKHRFWFGEHPAALAQGILNCRTPAGVAGLLAETLATDGWPWASVTALIERVCALGDSIGHR